MLHTLESLIRRRNKDQCTMSVKAHQPMTMSYQKT
jgi:hypothetical protein